MKKLIFLGILLIIPAASSANDSLSDADKNGVYKMAENLAECSAFFEYMSKDNSSKKVSVELHELSNGAESAGAWTLFKMGVLNLKSSYNYVSPLVETDLHAWEAREESAVSNSNDKQAQDQLLKDIKLQQKKCLVLKDYQAESVVEMRRYMVENSK